MLSVLVVDGDRFLADRLARGIRRAGMQARLAGSAEEALSSARRRPPDLVLLDLELPGTSGTDLFRELKSDRRTRTSPVVVVSGRRSEEDRVVAFELGVDDFVAKPYSQRELLLRIRGILRHAARRRAERAVLAVGVVRMDLDAHRVWSAGERVELAPQEFRLLQALLERAGEALTREQLLSEVWGISDGSGSRTLDSHVRQLRRKLGAAREMVETVRHVGYRFADPEWEGNGRTTIRTH